MKKILLCLAVVMPLCNAYAIVGGQDCPSGTKYDNYLEKCMQQICDTMEGSAITCTKSGMVKCCKYNPNGCPTTGYMCSCVTSNECTRDYLCQHVAGEPNDVGACKIYNDCKKETWELWSPITISSHRYTANLTTYCSQGCYLDGTTCRQCPGAEATTAASNEITVNGQTLKMGTGGVTSCYLENGKSYTDESGEFTVSENCQYSGN